MGRVGRRREPLATRAVAGATRRRRGGMPPRAAPWPRTGPYVRAYAPRTGSPSLARRRRSLRSKAARDEGEASRPLLLRKERERVDDGDETCALAARGIESERPVPPRHDELGVAPGSRRRSRPSCTGSAIRFAMRRAAPMTRCATSSKSAAPKPLLDVAVHAAPRTCPFVEIGAAITTSPSIHSSHSSPLTA